MVGTKRFLIVAVAAVDFNKCCTVGCARDCIQPKPTAAEPLGLLVQLLDSCQADSRNIMGRPNPLGSG